MMRTTLRVLDSTGDTPLTWDHSDPARCAEIRTIVADLKRSGYSFFLVDGTPADEVSAGAGTLLVRKLTADEVIPEPAETSAAPETTGTLEVPPRRRGRPPKAVPGASDERNLVAVRPIRGGCDAR